MAKDKKRRQPKLKDGQVRLDKPQQKVKKDIEGGQNLSSILGLVNPLSRVSTDLPEDQKAYLESIRQLADPSSAGFIGKRSDEEKKGVSELDSVLQEAKTVSADELKAKGNLENLVATAGQRSADMAETLNLMKSGLAGLSAPENQALREQAQREVDRKKQSAVEAVQNSARRSGMRGGAVQAGLRAASRDAVGAQADLEQKNLVSNIDIQDRRRNDYVNNLGGVEGREFAQKSDASNNYADAIRGFTDSRFNRMTSAADAYSGRVNQLGSNERQNIMAANENYGAGLKNRDENFLATTKVNLGQERTDRAAQNASVMGLAGLTENERARRRARRENKRRNNGSNSNTSTNPAADPNQAARDYINEVANIYGQPGV